MNQVARSNLIGKMMKEMIATYDFHPSSIGAHLWQGLRIQASECTELQGFSVFQALFHCCFSWRRERGSVGERLTWLQGEENTVQATFFSYAFWTLRFQFFHLTRTIIYRLNFLFILILANSLSSRPAFSVYPKLDEMLGCLSPFHGLVFLGNSLHQGFLPYTVFLPVPWGIGF